MSDAPIRIVIADDHTVVRQGIRHVLDGEPDIQVVAEASDGREAVDLVREHAPDVVVLDITMPEMTGVEATRALRAEGLDAGILILSMHDNPEYVLEAVRAGADGYVLKDVSPSELRQAVRTVREGREYYEQRVTHQLSVALRSELERQHRRSRFDSLTQREREVLLRVADGKTSREIADEFGISPRTVETHRERVMAKLRIRTVAGLTRYVLENRLTEDASVGE